MTDIPMQHPISSLDELVTAAQTGKLGGIPATEKVTVAFSTRQGAQHDDRRNSYRNHVISLRIHRAVGSCAIEPHEIDDETVYNCVGKSIGELLEHPSRPIRVAALDAFLAHTHPHETYGRQIIIAAGSSREKSIARAKTVANLLPCKKNDTVLVVGVVNSLLHTLRERGVDYIPSDLKGGKTEQGEPIIRDFSSALDKCDSLLVSGMVLGNGSFETILHHALATKKPLAMFAQTGSSVLPWFIGSGVTAVSAEPYPFFWLDGGKSTLYQYESTPER